MKQGHQTLIRIPTFTSNLPYSCNIAELTELNHKRCELVSILIPPCELVSEITYISSYNYPYQKSVSMLTIFSLNLQTIIEISKTFQITSLMMDENEGVKSSPWIRVHPFCDQYDFEQTISFNIKTPFNLDTSPYF